jgi:hypothetical protein
MHVLSTNHPSLFGDQLLNHILAFAMRMIGEKEYQDMREIPLDAKRKLFQAQSYRLGTRLTSSGEWVCPGFELV